MSPPAQPQSDEVDQLLLNAQLRDELEPFVDEAITHLNVRRIPTSVENEYLESMLAWERAPILSIADWFEPRLELPHPRSVRPNQMKGLLWRTIRKLYEKRIILDFTDHLSDRELYVLIYRDILPTPEKKMDVPGHYLHWDCADMSNDSEVWLRFYASEEERQMWAGQFGDELPPSELPPYPRDLPRQPL